MTNELSSEFVKNVLDLVKNKPYALSIPDPLSAYGGNNTQSLVPIKKTRWIYELEKDLERLGLV